MGKGSGPRRLPAIAPLRASPQALISTRMGRLPLVTFTDSERAVHHAALWRAQAAKDGEPLSIWIAIAPRPSAARCAAEVVLTDPLRCGCSVFSSPPDCVHLRLVALLQATAEGRQVISDSTADPDPSRRVRTDPVFALSSIGDPAAPYAVVFRSLSTGTTIFCPETTDPGGDVEAAWSRADESAGEDADAEGAPLAAFPTIVSTSTGKRCGRCGYQPRVCGIGGLQHDSAPLNTDLVARLTELVRGGGAVRYADEREAVFDLLPLFPTPVVLAWDPDPGRADAWRFRLTIGGILAAVDRYIVRSEDADPRPPCSCPQAGDCVHELILRSRGCLPAIK